MNCESWSDLLAHSSLFPYLETHARRIFADAISPNLAAARALAGKIETGKITDRFVARDVYRQCWSGLATPEDVKSAVEILVDYDWLHEETSATSGRSRKEYRINPKIKVSPSRGTDKADASPLPSVKSAPADGDPQNSDAPTWVDL